MNTKGGMRQWLDAYGESHQHPTNELVHWICVPTIFFCVVGLVASIPSPSLAFVTGYLWVKLALMFTLLFYARRSFPLFIGMALWCICCFALAVWLDMTAPWPLWSICAVLFVLAWIGQFIGHRIEGKKPSFLDDIRFLLIGPAWLMAKVYDRLGVGY